MLCIDLIELTQTYANRTFQCVRGFKLCANLQIKNVVTSDFLYEPGVSHAEARMRGTTAIPRELSFPCEKCENWLGMYDYVLFPSESVKECGQSRIVINLSELGKNCANDRDTLKAMKREPVKAIGFNARNSLASYVQQHVPPPMDSNLTGPRKFSNKFKNGKDKGIFYFS